MLPAAHQPCAVCRRPPSGNAWGVPLCDEHFAQWTDAAPTSGKIATAAPAEHIESSTETAYFGRMVVLNPGVLKRSYQLWTERWLVRVQKGSAEVPL